LQALKKKVNYFEELQDNKHFPQHEYLLSQPRNPDNKELQITQYKDQHYMEMINNIRRDQMADRAQFVEFERDRTYL
jgi:hypothetical protein